MAWFLDRSFSIAGKHFGFDPLIGLIPAVGDLIGALLSLYILYEAARLGIPWAILLRMAWNILVDTVLGEIPVVGDAFDFVWQSNTWNIELVEKYLSPALRPRPISKILGTIILIALILIVASFGFACLLALGIWKLFHL